jgi:hypothetical protein
MITLSITVILSVLINMNAGAVIHGPGHDHRHKAEHPQPGHHRLDYSYREDIDEYAPPKPDSVGDRWWRGNLHTHTLWSDGDQFPEVVVDWYKRHHYEFLVLSDHNIIQEGEKWIDPEESQDIQWAGGDHVLKTYRERFSDHWVEMRTEGDRKQVRLKPLNEFRHLFEEPDRFLLMLGEEITDDRAIHVNATNIVNYIPPQGGETVTEIIENNMEAVYEQRRRTGQPMFPHLNHPNYLWAVTVEDMAPVEKLRFFEIYNGHRGVANFGDDIRPGLGSMWDILLTLRLAEKGFGVVYGIATDDAHHYEQSELDVARPGRGWVMVRSRFLTPEHLIAALEAGDFYASTGVVIQELHVDPERGLRVVIRPEENVTYTTRFIGTRHGYNPERKPRVDENGEVIEGTTKLYSDDIGLILKEAEGTEAIYEFTGDEIYVRAKIISSKLKDNPFTEGEREKAWLQPVIPAEIY